MYNYGFPPFCITIGVFHSFACVVMFFLFYASRNSLYMLLASVGWPEIQSSLWRSGQSIGLNLGQNVGHALQPPMPQYSVFARIITRALFSTRNYCLHIVRSAPFSQICSHIDKTVLIIKLYFAISASRALHHIPLSTLCCKIPNPYMQKFFNYHKSGLCCS